MGEVGLGPVSISVAVAVVGLFVWLAAEGQFIRYARRRGAVLRPSSSLDRGSVIAVWVSIWAGLAVAFAANGVGLRPSLPIWSVWVGAALLAIGVGTRGWALLTLGRSYSMVVTTRVDQALVTHGPYRWIRHPAYTGNLLTVSGLALVLGSVLGVTAAVIIVLSGHLYRIRVEEQALRARFGELYSQYEGRTWRLIPWVY